MDEAIIRQVRELIDVVKNMSMRQLVIMDTLDTENGSFPSIFKEAIVEAKKDYLLLDQAHARLITMNCLVTGLNDSQTKED